MSKYTDYESAKIATVTVHLVLTIFNIAGNSLVCAVIFKNRVMRTPVNYLLMNLAIADMTVAIFFVPRYILIHTYTHPDGITGRMLCKFLTRGTLAWVGGAASVVTLVAIAVERFYVVMYPHGHKRKLTDHKLKVIIPSSWIFGFIFLLQSFLIRTFDKEAELCSAVWPKQWMGKAYSLAWLLILALFPVSMMAVLYSRVIYALWFTADPDSNHRQQGLLKVRKRVTLIAITVSVIFGVCWLTQSVSYVLSVFITTHNLGNVIYVITTTMIMVNSAINPFVYSLLSQQFRRKAMALICCSFRRPAKRLHPTRESQKMDSSSQTDSENKERLKTAVTPVL